MNTPVSPENAHPMNESMNASEIADFAALLKNQARRVVGKLPLLGAVGWLMMQQNATRHTLLSELEWRVMPALVLEQAKLYMRDESPVAYVSWAKLSDTAAQRFITAPHQLMPSDWQSGEHMWLIDLFAPFGGAQDVMNDLRTNVLAGHPISQLHLGEAGVAKTVVWPAR